MRLTVIGCSGSFPGPDSPASCYLVEHEDFRILLDLGNGALGALQKYASVESIDAVLLSHLHPDHCIDMTSMYVVRKHNPQCHLPQIPVYGPNGTADRLARAYDLPTTPGMTREFDFTNWTNGVFDIGPFRVETALMAHPVPCFAMRVSAAGKSLVYSGDTGPTQVLVDLARGADLALFEASFLDGDNPPDLHLSAREAADHAQRAGVGQVVLTHLVPWNDRSLSRAQALFDGPLDLAESGQVWNL